MLAKAASGEYEIGDMIPAEKCPACKDERECTLCMGTKVVYKPLAERYRWGLRWGRV